MTQIAHVSRFGKDSPCGQSVCEPQWANACGQLAVCCLLLPAFTSFLQLQPCVSHVSAMCQPCTELQCADASCITNYQLIVRLHYHSFWCNILAICWSHKDKMCLTTNSMSVSFATAACVCVCICAEWHLHMMQHVYVYVYVQSGICIWCSTGMCMYICSHTCIWCIMSAQKACSCFCNPLMRCCDWPSSVSFEFISSVSVLAMDRSTCSICYMFIYLFVYSN